MSSSGIRKAGSVQSPKTFSKYKSIIDLYKLYLESYWPGHGDEYAVITKKGGTYCGTFGPEDATVGYWEFLGYYMRCKVICGKETKQAAITVTKKLAKWLSDKGYVKDTGTAQVPAKEAVEDLPNGRKANGRTSAFTRIQN